MSTSGSTNFTQTRDQLISDALALLGVIGIVNGTMETPTAGDITFCSSILNKMVKAWQAKGLHLWSEREGTVFLRDAVNTYILDTSTGDYAGDNCIETELTTSASGATLAVTSTAGMTAADVIGIALDDNTRQWTTIASVDTTTQVTLNTSLTSTAASGNNVSSYTTKMNRPLYIKSARFRSADGTDRPVRIMGRTEFMNISNKATEGKINSIYYSPQVGVGRLYVWPTPDDVNDRLEVSYVRTIEDFDATGDNPDFPAEWLEALTYNLAARVSSSYGIDLTKKATDIAVMANNSLLDLQLWDSEESSLKIVPNYRYD